MAIGTNCARRAPRTNMFVMAALSAGEFSGPVKVRNLSTTGALIEGPGLPPVGAKATLRREESVAHGEIVWCAGAKAGLKVDGDLEVADWMPGSQTHQNSIDRVIETVKEQGAMGLIAHAIDNPASIDANNLQSLADAICLLADELADDENVVARFSLKLQTLDIAVQTLRKLAAERQCD